MNDPRSGVEKTRAGTAVHPDRYVATRTRKYKKTYETYQRIQERKTTTTTLYIIDSESSVAIQMQGGCVSAHAAVIATCPRAIATVQALAMVHRAMATSCQAPAMGHRAMATAQALAMGHCAMAIVEAPAVCHC